MKATRRFINADGQFDGGGSAQVDLKPPDGLHWLWVILTASYSAPLIVGGRVDAWYEHIVSSDGDSTKRVSLMRYPMDKMFQFPIFNGWFGALANDPVILRGNPAFLHQDKDHVSIAYTTLAASTAKFQIRGMVWEGPDLSELLCIARGAV